LSNLAAERDESYNTVQSMPRIFNFRWGFRPLQCGVVLYNATLESQMIIYVSRYLECILYLIFYIEPGRRNAANR